MSAAVGEPRTLALPARRSVAVAGNAPVGAYRLITARDSAGPSDPRPGQFYMLTAARRWGGAAGERPYLPRAFSFARARPMPGGGCQLDFLLEQVGPGTERLAELAEREMLELLGPLGAGFRPPPDGTQPLLVGGGIGVAPLLALHDELSAAAPAPLLLLGFRSAEHAEAATLFAGERLVTTDDGTAGRAGLVTEPLRERLERDPGVTVYACGPPTMLEAVRALCAASEVPAQLALESGMACGFGACFGCVAPTRDGYLRVCVDGPVVDASLLETALVPGAGH